MRKVSPTSHGSTALTHLQLEETEVTDAGLTHRKRLTKLKRLFLAGTRVSDTGIRHLKALPQLVYLDAEGTRVTDDRVAELQHAIPGVRTSR
jgi:hypothetical protein